MRKVGRKQYEILEHTADVGLRIYGDSYPELFANAGKAFFELISDPGRVEEKQAVRVEVDGEGREELFLRWLTELHFLVNRGGWYSGAFLLTG